jgi:hypothetical protein
MRIQTFTPPFTVASPASRPQAPLRQLYRALLDEPLDDATRNASAAFLAEQLQQAAGLHCDLPAQPEQLFDWVDAHTAAVGDNYRDYLAARKNGQKRRYFPRKAHALAFLRAVAPTKLVDGAWLYSTLSQAQDPRFHNLIRTYLEELGDGDAGKNHVLLYRKLLASHECEDLEGLPDAFYLQGCIQLSLAHHGERYLPEVIGFNLGYEQLPLHLLITAYELNELGIDPYYFTLHVTVDNAASGHARKAVQAVLDLLPEEPAEAREFLRRVALGYRLNDLGIGTCEAIAGFDLEQELIDILIAKAKVGQYLHSDYCRIAGQTVNHWLSEPARMPEFLELLQSGGWIKRGQPVSNSRFWKLIDGERAEMFGVFNAYERQVLHDWILGDGEISEAAPRSIGTTRTFRQQLRANQRLACMAMPSAASRAPAELEQTLAGLDPLQRGTRMLKLLSPAHHHSEAGLQATRLFAHNLTAAVQ